MIQSLTGINHLVENDIVEILREHFGRYGYGFKRIKFSIDSAERDKPRFEIDLKLTYIGKRRGRKKRVDILYDELMTICNGEIKAESAIIGKLFDWVREDYIDKEEFESLIGKVKGL
jgi:hypothetical protein